MNSGGGGMLVAPNFCGPGVGVDGEPAVSVDVAGFPFRIFWG